MIAAHPYYEGIRLALIADDTAPTVADLTQHRFYADQMPNDPELPGVRFALLADPIEQRLSNSDHTTAELQIDVYARRGDEILAWRINEAIRRALDRKDLPVPNVARAHAMCLDRGVPIREASYYRIRSRYRLYV